jgi:hypothetical protein
LASGSLTGSAGRGGNMHRQLGCMAPDIRNGRTFQENAAHDRTERPNARRNATILRDDAKVVRDIKPKAVAVWPNQSSLAQAHEQRVLCYIDT